MTLYNKVYSIGVDDQSPVGQVSTRDLDPFGSGTNESLGLFGGASISDLYPYYLTLTPDSIDQISDFSFIHFTKGVSGSDFINQTDSVFVRSQFNRNINDIQIAIDEVQSFGFNKRLYDSSTLTDNTSLSLNKPLQDLINNLEDKKYLSISKVEFDSVNLISDSVEALAFGKGLFDTQVSIDAIQSFDINKVLTDYANPVDLVNIPDGSTFQLNKTLRNTINLSDEQSFVVNKLNNEIAYGLDVSYLNVYKPFEDINGLSDNNILSFIKSTIDLQIINDYSKLDFNKVLIDAQSVLDFTNIDLNKFINDLIASNDILQTINVVKVLNDDQFSFDQIQSFYVTKLLQDYANPVDLVNIPDGSTFQLNKTLRNTVDNIIDVISLIWYFNRSLSDSVDYINDQQFLSFVKSLSDDQLTNDQLQQFVVGKVLNDNQYIGDLTALSFSTNRQDLAYVTDLKSIQLNKTVDDDNIVDDLITTKSFNKSIQDISTQFDQIQSFDISKVLEDYANPVDYVGIPDGSTFQLFKTLRNTVLTSDSTSLVWQFYRSFTNEAFTNDLITFIALGKQKDETQLIEDEIQQLVITKSLFDSITPNEFVSLEVNKLLSNTQSVYDNSIIAISKFTNDNTFVNDTFETINFNKVNSDELLTSDNNIFYVTKLLQDYANPIDLVNIPDGSVFQLNKTLRNTITLNDDHSFNVDKSLSEIQLVTEQKYLTFSAIKNELVNVSDTQSLHTVKTLSDSVTIFDEILQGRNIVENESDSTSIFETLEYSLIKSLYDVSISLESIVLNLSRPLFDIANNTDLSKLRIVKPLYDFSLTSDYRSNHLRKSFAEYFTPDYIKNFGGDNDYENETLGDWDLNIGDLFADFNSGSFKITNIISDRLQSISFNKGINDFANAVDLVGIPDGSTFQFNKTLRNTALIEDLFNRTVSYNRNYFDVQTLNDTCALTYDKALSNSLNTTDTIYRQVDYDRTFNDYILVNDILSLSSGDAEHPIELLIISDNNKLSISKLIVDQYTTSDTNYKLIEKALSDNVINSDLTSKVIGKYFTDYITAIENSNVTIVDTGNDYTSSQGDLSNIEDSGFLYMTDYADITYFAEDYVGETRSFT